MAGATKGRAALRSLLQYYAPERAHAVREAPVYKVGELTASAITELGLADAASWNTVSETIAECPTWAPAKAGPTPGEADWATTYDLGSSAQKLALAIEIPKSITVGLYSDSVL